MDSIECVSCGKPKASLHCEICQDAICKKCEQLLEPNAFSFLPKIPETLSHLRYCGSCFDSLVAPEKEHYEQVMEKARQVFVFFVTQKKPPPLIRKDRELLKVEDCDDRDETILRLGFLAALKNFNAIIEVDVKQHKIRKGAYQTSRWSGTAYPAMVNGDHVELQDRRDRIFG